MQILIFHEKHGDRYFAVANQVDIEAVATKMVLERMKGDWYYFIHEDGIPPLPKVPLADATEEKFGKEIARRIQQEWRQYNNMVKEYEQGQADKELLSRIKSGYQSPEVRKLAWKFLQARAVWEYEDFDIEEIEEYQKDFNA